MRKTVESSHLSRRKNEKTSIKNQNDKDYFVDSDKKKDKHFSTRDEKNYSNHSDANLPAYDDDVLEPKSNLCNSNISIYNSSSKNKQMTHVKCMTNRKNFNLTASKRQRPTNPRDTGSLPITKWGSVIPIEFDDNLGNK